MRLAPKDTDMALKLKPNEHLSYFVCNQLIQLNKLFYNELKMPN